MSYWHLSSDPKRECSSDIVNHLYRDDELQSWMSSGQMTQADEGPQSIPRFCTLDQRGSATVHFRKNTDRSLITQSPSLSLLPRHCCHLREPIQRSAFTSPLNYFVINYSQTVTGTSSKSDLMGIFRLIRKDLNFWTTDEFKSFIIICDAAIPKQLFRNIGYSEDGRTFIGNAGCRFSDKHVSSDLRKVTLHSPCESSDNGSQDSQTEMVHGDYFPRGKLKSLLKSCQNPDHSGVSSESNGNVKTSKSVSFSDDVIVYMFNQVLITGVGTLAWWVWSLFSSGDVSFTDHSTDPNQWCVHS